MFPGNILYGDIDCDDADGNLTDVFVAGDMNCDNVVDNSDVDAFVLAILAGPPDYEDYYAEYPNCDVLNGDCNGDSVVDSSDIDAFSALLAGPGAGGSAVRVHLTWDAENRLKAWEALEPRTAASRKLSFDYDWMGRRIEKKVSAWNTSTHAWDQISDTKYVWDGWLLLEELDASNSNAPIRQYTWGLDLAGQNGSINDRTSAGGIGGLLAMYDVANSTGYGYFYNGNGDVGQVVRHSDGTIGAKYQYDPYGNTIASGGSLEQPWRFSTKQFDDESGLYYNDHRYYGAKWGRWGSRDPYGETLSPSLVSAFSNRPSQRVDPVGLQDQTSCCTHCGPDVSDWFVRQLNIIRRLGDAKWPSTWAIASDRAAYTSFWRTMKCERLDYRRSSCPSKECHGSVTLCGGCLDVTELGNIAFGYAAAHSVDIMLWGGLYAEVYGKRGFSNSREIRSALLGWLTRVTNSPPLGRSGMCTSLQVAGLREGANRLDLTIPISNRLNEGVSDIDFKWEFVWHWHRFVVEQWESLTGLDFQDELELAVWRIQDERRIYKRFDDISPEFKRCAPCKDRYWGPDIK